MVWFYGGAFILGGTRPYNLEDLALHGGVVVVSVAYRVGPLGFLSTGDDAAPGNYGLWDAVVALRWIQENAGFVCPCFCEPIRKTRPCVGFTSNNRLVC